MSESKTLADFQAIYDPKTERAKRVNDMLVELRKDGPEAWAYGFDLTKRFSIGTQILHEAARTTHADHVVEVKTNGNKGTRDVWFADVKAAKKARELITRG